MEVEATLGDIRALLEDRRADLQALEGRMAKTAERLAALGGSTVEAEVREAARLRVWMQDAEVRQGELKHLVEVLERVQGVLVAMPTAGAAEAPVEVPEPGPPAGEANPPTGGRAARVRRRMAIVAVPVVVMLLFYGLGGLEAGSWPPSYLLVGSGSMEHGEVSHVGTLDAGDTVVVGRTDHVVTYLEGRRTGYTTYGDYGDVLVFEDPLNGSDVFLHRPLAWVHWNESAGGFDVPDLATLPPGGWMGYGAGGNATAQPMGLEAFSLIHAGWTGNWTVTYDLRWLVDTWRTQGDYPGPYHVDGYLTWGDNNVYRLPTQVDPWIVVPSMVLGVARGEVPVIGLLRLSLAPSADGCCTRPGDTHWLYGAPANSWWSLGVLLGLAGLAPWTLHRTIRDIWPILARGHALGALRHRQGRRVRSPSPGNEK